MATRICPTPSSRRSPTSATARCRFVMAATTTTADSRTPRWHISYRRRGSTSMCSHTSLCTSSSMVNISVCSTCANLIISIMSMPTTDGMTTRLTSGRCRPTLATCRNAAHLMPIWSWLMNCRPMRLTPTPMQRSAVCSTSTSSQTIWLCSSTMVVATGPATT